MKDLISIMDPKSTLEKVGLKLPNQKDIFTAKFTYDVNDADYIYHYSKEDTRLQKCVSILSG